MFAFVASSAQKATHLSEAVSHNIDNAVAAASKAATTKPSPGVLSAADKTEIRSWLAHSYESQLSASGDILKIRKQKQISYTRAKLEGRVIETKSLRLPAEAHTPRSPLDVQKVTASYTPDSGNGFTNPGITPTSSSSFPLRRASSTRTLKINEEKRVVSRRGSTDALSSDSPDASHAAPKPPSSAQEAASQYEKKGHRMVYGVLGGFFGLSVLLAALAPLMNGKSSQNPEHQK